MLKPLKFKGEDKNFFFAGCLHHRHRPAWNNPLWKMRGFESGEEHDEFQIQAWNKVCNKDSIVFLLGDTIFNDPKGNEFQNLFRRLNFKQVFVQPGNHFSGWLQNYRSSLSWKYPDLVMLDGTILAEVYPLDDMSSTYEASLNEKILTYIPNYAELDINGLQISICHYAIRSWNKMARHSWMLHSHEHCSSRESDWLTTDCGKIADVGYENLLKYNDGAPVSLEKLKKIMDKKPYKPEGHH
jgi:calcineurin-like phosphoesterase family protein